MYEYFFLGLVASPWEMVEVVAVAVFFSNLITVCLPNKSDNKFCQFLIDTLNTLSMNIMRNANKMYPKRFPIPRKPRRKKRASSAKARAVGARAVGGSDD